MKKGKVYIVGAGAGSRDLITLKGLRVLKQAEVVIYDYLVDKGLLAEARSEAELVCCDVLGKRRYADGFSHSQKRINSLIIARARQGKKVVRLKNGDPFIFSRAKEELEALTKKRIEFEVVPGVTAAQVASCFTGIPLTSRGLASSVVLLTGHEAEKRQRHNDWQKIAGCDTIVLYMGMNTIDRITQQLIEAGRTPNTPVAAVQEAGRITQKVARGTLGDIAETCKREKILPPAVFIIGETVRLGERFDWLKKNRRILFTGISDERYFLKGTYFHLPLIEIKPLGNYAKLDRILRNVGIFDWVVFCSRYGVEYFFQRLNALGLDTRVLQGVKIAAVGNSTAGRLLEFGLKADLVPAIESAKGLLAAFKKQGLKNKRILFARSNLSDKGLSQGLNKLGAKVTTSIAYRNLMPQGLPNLELSFFDEIVFTSPSGARNFVTRYGLPPKKVKIRCIGEVTRAQAEKLKVV